MEEDLMEVKHWIAVLVVTVAVFGGGIIASITLKDDCKCSGQKECVPCLVSGPVVLKQQPAVPPKPAPRKVVKTKPPCKKLTWRGRELPTDLNEAKRLANTLFKGYWDTCLAKYKQGPFYKGLISCIERDKIHDEWLKDVSKQENPRIELWARVVAQYMLSLASDAICKNKNPYSLKNPPSLKLTGKQRIEFRRTRDLLLQCAKDNALRFDAFISRLEKTGKIDCIPELPFPYHESCQ